MADFCRACSIEMWGYDTRDLAGLGPELPSGAGYVVICEDCGFILVDHQGNCVECQLKQGQRGHDGKILKPLEGGRIWCQPELYDFTYGEYDGSTIELGAPL